jgi:ATP-dependent Lhr-like helicase
VEQIALALLRRYGVVFMRMLEREAAWMPRWRDLLRVYRKLEARGEIRGGRFVSGFSGEQFALPEAVAALRAVRRRAHDDSLVSVSGADPLNLAGILTPGPKLAAIAGNRVLYRDGVPVAFLEGDTTRFLTPVEPEIENLARLALHGHAEPAAHLPRMRRLAQLEAAQAVNKSRRGYRGGRFAA